MGWLKVVFFIIVISRMDSTQDEINDTGDHKLDLNNLKTTTVPTLTPPPCETTANGCRIKNELFLNFKNFNKTTVAKIETTETYTDCYQFNKIDDSFVVKINDSRENFCIYDLLSDSGKALYYIDGFNLQLQSVCPKEEKICITEKVENVTANCSLTNFTVTHVFNDEAKYINLKLSWDKVDGGDLVDVSIRAKFGVDENPNCLSEMDVIDHPLATNSVLQPNMLTGDEVYPGCEYNIVLASKWWARDPIYCFATYIVPNVTKNEFSEQLPKIVDVAHISDNKFMVSWDPGKTLDGDLDAYNDVYFKYGIELLESAGVVSNDLKQHTSLIVMKLSAEKNYTLVGTFVYNDSYSVESLKYYFIAPVKNDYVVTILISSLALLVVIIIAFMYKKISQYIHKLLPFISQEERENQPSLELVRFQTEQIPMIPNVQYTPCGISEGTLDEYEFPRDKIILKEPIGSGAFGQVYSAKAIGIGGIRGYRMVAVKTLSEDENITRETTNDFLAEIEIFKKIGCHSNVVTLLGCCTVDTPYMMIMELVPCGDLKKYLVDLRAQWAKRKNIGTNRQFFFPDNSDGTSVGQPSPISPVSTRSGQLPSTSESIFTMSEDPMTPLLAHFTLDKVLDHTELQNFAFQIAKGMAHLEKIKITHRDLAARNVLISEHKILKISDFGLSRCGPYVNPRTKKLPLRWMAIEAIVEQKYDSRSDVWSFGVVLWEIGTLGAFPYESVPNSFLMQFLQLGRRLERPEICTNELYSLMMECWCADPDQRPTFQELVEALDVKKRKIYVNFNQLNPTYIFPLSDIEEGVESPV